MYLVVSISIISGRDFQKMVCHFFKQGLILFSHHQSNLNHFSTSYQNHTPYHHHANLAVHIITIKSPPSSSIDSFIRVPSSRFKMWQKEDPFTTPITSPNLPYRWARGTRHSRFSGLRVTPTRIGLALIVCGCLYLFHGLLPKGVVTEVLSNLVIVMEELD